MRLRHERLFEAENYGGQTAAPAGETTAADQNNVPAGESQHNPLLSGKETAAPAAETEMQMPPAEPYYPDNLAENLRGKSDKETIDRLAKAVAGYRQRDSKNNVPKTVDEYYDFAGTDIPDDVSAYFKDMKDDPVYQSLAKEALANGVPKTVLQKITTSAFQAAYEAGILEPPLDVAKEREALIPPDYQNAGKAAQNKAIDARLKANEDFINLLVKDGKMAKDVGEYSLLMLMDSAAGNKFLEAFRWFATGGQMDGPIVSGGGSDTLSTLRAEMAELQKNRNDPGFAEKMQALDAKYKQMIGD